MGTMTCAQDGHWWAVDDANDPPGQVSELEEVYVDGELCYRRSRIGLMKLGPRVEQITEMGVAPAFPVCNPGCCPFRTSSTGP